MTAEKTLVMGIVNVTPDSFSDGGKYFEVKNAIQHAYKLIEDGADILDVGAESTRPGAREVDSDEEWARLAPVLAELCQNSPVPVSVDTYKASVAGKALDMGVQIINDVWGGLREPDILRVAAEAKCEYIWMHNRDTPVESRAFENLVSETKRGVEACLTAGIARERLWIDPGIGFGKTHGQNLLVMKRLSEYTRLGYPVLLGTSRKRIIGNTLNLPPNDRLEGSLATVSVGVLAGVRCVRVHDVLETVRTCRMVEAIRDASE